MAQKTGISWTDHTFNPWMGCFKVSAGCKHCYADTLTSTRMGLDVFGPDTSKRQRTGKSTWNQPRRWNRDALAGEPGARGPGPHMVFCASLADVFEDAPGPNQWRPELWDLIRETTWLDWQLLTKRPENIIRMLPDDWDADGDCWAHVWLGTSIEDNEVVDRATTLTAVPARIHFISYEPALGPLDKLDLTGIEWLIVGGESGPGYRRMSIVWAHHIRKRCMQAGTAFFFKQFHGFRSGMGVDALGEVVHEFPQAWQRTLT